MIERSGSGRAKGIAERDPMDDALFVRSLPWREVVLRGLAITVLMGVALALAVVPVAGKPLPTSAITCEPLPGADTGEGAGAECEPASAHSWVPRLILSSHERVEFHVSVPRIRETFPSEVVVDLGTPLASSIIVEERSPSGEWLPRGTDAFRSSSLGPRYLSFPPSAGTGTLRVRVATRRPAAVAPRELLREEAAEGALVDLVTNALLAFGILLVGFIASAVGDDREMRTYRALCFGMALTILSASGLGPWFLWEPGTERVIHAVSHGATPWALVEFYRLFLGTRASAPRLDRVLRFLRAGFLACVPALLLAPFEATFVLSALAIALAAANVGGVVFLWRRLGISQRVYGVGLFLFMAGASVYAVDHAGLAAIGGAGHSMLAIGMFAEANLLSQLIAFRARARDLEARELERATVEKERRRLQLVRVAFDVFLETDGEFVVLSVEGAEPTPLRDFVGCSLPAFLSLPGGSSAIAPFDPRGEEIRDAAVILRMAEGDTLHLRLNGIRTTTPSGIGAGARTRWLFSVSDRTAQERAEASAARAVQLASLGTMAAGIAHEINSPLATIRLHVDVLLESLRDEPLAVPRKALDRLERVTQQIARMAGIIRSIRSFYREGEPLADTVVSFRPLVAAVVEEFGMHAARADVALAWKAETVEDVSVRGDAVLLAQVITNLVKNALEALTGRPSPREARVVLAIAGNDALIEVIDTGPGVPPAFRSRLFDPFFTTKDVGAGTGLGLALSHSIIAKHGGELSYREGGAGAGGHFVVRVPLARIPAGGA